MVGGALLLFLGWLKPETPAPVVVRRRYRQEHAEGEAQEEEDNKTMSDDERPLLPEDQQVWLQGPVELIDGKFTLAILLSEGGDRLQASARSISYVARDCLNVVIRDWLARELGIVAGSRVAVDNRDGRFNITVV